MKPCHVILVVLTASIVEVTALQTRARAPQSREQSHFSVEHDYVGQPVRQPVALPKAVLHILTGTRRVVVCAKAENIPVERIPKEWFISSEIHLDGSVEKDLVVLASLDLDVTPSNRCLNGANVGPFWIFKHASTGYHLTLDATGHDLDVLPSRTMGYRDIRVTAATGTMLSTSVYKFDGREYKIYANSLKPIN